jgi:type I site-specific restriction endonuclease
VIEAKRACTDPRTAEKQATDYARQLGVPFVFLTNGTEADFANTSARRTRTPTMVASQARRWSGRR